MAVRAASDDSSSTKPNPRERPVVGSVMSSADTSVPKGRNKSSSSGKHSRGGKLPTYRRTLNETSIAAVKKENPLRFATAAVQ